MSSLERCCYFMKEYIILYVLIVVISGCGFTKPDVIPDIQKHCNFLSETYSLPKVVISDTDYETKVKIENLIVRTIESIDKDTSITDDFKTLYKQACIEFLTLINMSFEE